MVKIHNKSVEDFCKSYRGEKFHALFCDAPYSLGDGTKGFMNKEWDNDVACKPDTWIALSEHLLPGAFLFVFAGTLNDDLISVAMRQAGLRKFHKTINWGTGSGFPKATRIDVAIDRAAGAKREVIVSGRWIEKYPNGPGGGKPSQLVRQAARKSDGPLTDTLPSTPLAKTWAGHRYGLQAIKPSAETILIFQKPYDGKPVDSIVKNGAGALWVDGGRIGTEKMDGRGMSSLGVMHDDNWKPKQVSNPATGRWPANLILHHRPECNGKCTPDCAIAALDEQSGKLVSQWGKATRRDNHGMFGKRVQAENIENFIGDSGGASRFFFNADWSHEVQEQIENADAVRYQAKASRRERDAGLDLGQQYTGHRFGKRRCKICGRLQLDYNPCKCDNPNFEKMDASRNPHPTVKPIALARYLATLLLPPAEYAPRRILIPFGGVASEVVGAMLAGWEEVVAVEKEKEYCDIGRARVKYWEKHREPKVKPTRKADSREEMLQHSLF